MNIVVLVESGREMESNWRVVCGEGSMCCGQSRGGKEI